MCTPTFLIPLIYLSKLRAQSEESNLQSIPKIRCALIFSVIYTYHQTNKNNMIRVLI